MSTIAPAAHAMVPSRVPEPMEGPGPDRDGDADDKSISVSRAPQAQLAAPKGMGAAVDTKA